MAIKYSQKVIQEFTNPANVGDIDNANARATEGSAACGDMITYSLVINLETHVIEEIKFRSYGCASNIATASMATKIAKGRTIEEVKKLSPKVVTEQLEGLPAVKIHCSVLAINGLKSAIRQWEIENGLIEVPTETKEITRDHILETLRNVIHPETGVNLVKMNMIRDIVIDGPTVYVELLMGETEEMYYENI
ncbi:MAG: iron-sulfur cluster assembly scaffold protein, partial [bacterium]